MKSSFQLNRCLLAKLAVVMLALGFALPARLLAAPSPTLSVNLPSPFGINDEQAVNLFAGAMVTEGSTNVTTVYVDYTPTNYGSLSVSLVNGTNVFTVADAAAAQAFLGGLVFTPVANLITVPNSANVTFHVRVVDADDNVASDSLSLQITAKNNPPTITAGAPLAVSISDQQTAQVFANLTIADVDDSGTQSQTVTLTINETDINGTFTIPTSPASEFTLNSGSTNVYTFTGSPADATAAIQALIFVPTPHQVPVGSNVVTTFTVLVDDGYNGKATNSSYSVNVTAAEDPPRIAGVPASPLPVPTGGSTSPFSGVNFSDVDQNLDLSNLNGENLNWQVTLSGPSPLGYLTLNGVNIGSSYSSSGDPVVASGDLKSLAYHAPTVVLTGTNVLTLTITADDGHTGGLVSTNEYLNLYSVLSPAVLSGTQSGQIVYDNTAIALFSKVNIQSFNGDSVTVLISLAGGATNDIQGQLVNLGSFTQTPGVGAPSVYQFTGSSEAATLAMRALLFQPTPNRIPLSSTDTSIFGVTIIDGSFTNATDTSTTVIVVPVETPPTLAGISPLVTINDNQTVVPFSLVSVTDPNQNGQQPVTATITLDAANKGAFSTNSLIASGFTNNAGVYTFTGSPASLTAAIRQLVFIPTPSLVPVGLNEITTFTIKLNDGHGGIVVNSGTLVRVFSVSGGPFVTLPATEPESIRISSNILAFAGVTVSDTTFLNLAVRINDPNQGFFTTNSLAVAGFTNRGGGVYFISGWATNITAALAQLNFSPATNLLLGATINFTISVTNSLPNYLSVNHAIILRTVQNSFIVTKLTDYDPNGNAPLSQQYGTLRLAIATAKNNDHITFDIRSQTNGQPDYPAVLRLVAPLVLNNNLTFDGPGADRLTISGDSDGNGTADVQLFTINAAVTMNRLAFSQGFASFAGGAFEVTGNGDLHLSYCAVTASTAAVWGGGIDVDEGSLEIDHCLIASNSTSSTIGEGGGGISLYTYQPCSIANTTFAANHQNAGGGLGGGALYAATADPGLELDAQVVNCTFHDNRDAAGHGTAIRPDVDDNTVVDLQNSILADGQGKNIEMDWGGLVLSLGGNISDDATATIYTIGGGTRTNIFQPPADQLNVNATNLFGALANNGGPTWTYPLLPTSSAIGLSVSNFPGTLMYSNTLGTDQRGYYRDQNPDIGAFELGANQRVIIEELRFNPAPPNTNDQFIEFYVPRDSTNVDLGGFQVLVDGVLRYTFAPQPLEPGQALVLFSAGAVNTAVPSAVFSQVATNSLMMDTAGGAITLLNASNQVVFQADYVGTFVATDPADYGFLSANYQSLVLSPEFQGVFLPYQRVVAKEGGSDTNGLDNPGYNVLGSPLAIGNAPPLAYADSAATDAHTILPAINVLNNDVDPDINDVIRVVGVGVNGNPGVSGLTNYSVLGARIIINNSPTTGASVSYDPTASAYLTALPQGSNVVDSFQYTILDSLNGVDHSRGSSPAEIAQNLAKATATVTVRVVGVNSAPTPQNDNVTTAALLTTQANAVLDFTTATNILENDTDPNSDDNSSTLSIVSISPTNGYTPNTLSVTSVLGATVTLDIRFDRNQTHITYDPRGSAALVALGQGQTNYDTFYYSVADRYHAIGTAAISIQVIGVNNPPTANPDSLATDQNTPLVEPFSVFLANDTDPDTEDQNQLTISAVSSVSTLGASVVISNGYVVYDPTVSASLIGLGRKEFATDTFTYTAMDPWGASSNAVVTVIVAGLNDRPVSQPDAFTTGEKIPFTTNAPGVLANDYDPDIHDLIRVIPTTNTTPFGVTVVMNADGSFTYDPRTHFDWLYQGQVTNDAFSYVVMDHSLSIANNDVFTVTANSATNVLPVLANDAVLSAAGGAFTITGVSTPTQGGAVTISADGSALIYTPLSGFVGTESFTYTNADGLGGGDWAGVTVTVTGGTLYANFDSFIVAKGTTNTLNVLANDVIVPASTAAISLTSLGTPDSGGTVSLNGVGPNNLVNYTPSLVPPCPYTETFTYLATSGSLVATGLVQVTVIDRANTLPARNDFFTVLLNSGSTSLDVLANDGNLSATRTNLVITGFTTNSILGTVSLNTAQTRLVYKPSATVSDTNGYTDVIQYYFTDNNGGTGTATMTVHVIASGLVANDDYFVVQKNSVSNTLPVMINDVILPNYGQSLYISDIGIGTNAPNQGGSVAINGPGTGLIYTPGTNFTGEELFTYEITDGSPARAMGHVHVLVLDQSPLVSNPDTYRIQPNSVNNVLPVLSNDYPLPQLPGALTITGLQTNGVHGTVVLDNPTNGATLIYSPATGFIGRDQFTYELTDTLGNQGTNTVTVTVGSLYPRNDLFTVLSDSASNTLAVLANDLVYPDTNSVRPIYQLLAPDQGGSLATDVTGSVVLYTPAPGFVGTEHFTYLVKDDATTLFPATVTVQVAQRGSDRDTNTVTMTLIGTNDPPTIVDSMDSAITDKQRVYPFANITIGDLDEFDLQPLTVRIAMDNLDKGSLQNLGGFTQVAAGLFELYGLPSAINTALRDILYVPVPNHIPVPTTVGIHLVLSADDGYVSSPVTNLTTISVTAINDPPTISGTVPGQTVYNQSAILPFTSVTIADVDNDGQQPLRVTVALSNPTNGALSSLGAFVNSGGGVYTMGSSNGTATGAAISAALHGLLFTPTTGNRVSPGTNEITRFTILVDDFFAPTVVDSNTTVVAIAPLTAEVTAGDKTSGAEFGWAVAASRDLAVVGAPHDALTTNSGSVYLFARSLDGSNTWTQIMKLLAPDGRANDAFGTAVAISGDTLVVGSPNNTSSVTNSGAAYVYYRIPGSSNQWGFLTKLVGTNSPASDQFGASVSIDGDVIVVGEPLGNAGLASETGAAYVFERNQGGPNQWGVVRRLLSANPLLGDQFGSAVAVSETNVVVGAPGARVGGAAFVYQRNQPGTNVWGFVKTLVSTNAGAGDNFGSSVAISGDDIVVGLPLADYGTIIDSGAAYIFERNQSGANQWGALKRLVPINEVANFRFGSSVAINQNDIVIGVPMETTNGISLGAAYLYGRNQGGSNQWAQVDKFQPAQLSNNDYFGSSVSICSNTIVVGAYNGLVNSVRSGTAFMFRIKFDNGPRVLIPLTDQTVTLSSPLAYTIPPGAFADPDVNDTLQISVGNTPVPPAWLNFDPVADAFSGTPAVVGSYPIAVVATDSDGLSATNQFNINVIQVPVDFHTLSLGFQTYGTSQVVAITLNGVAGVTYTLQKTPSLTGNVVWTNIASATADVNGLILFYDISTANTMFYRAVPQ